MTEQHYHEDRAELVSQLVDIETRLTGLEEVQGKIIKVQLTMIETSKVSTETMELINKRLKLLEEQ